VVRDLFSDRAFPRKTDCEKRQPKERQVYGLEVVPSWLGVGALEQCHDGRGLLEVHG
jgi:hypothetical protein